MGKYIEVGTGYAKGNNSVEVGQQAAKQAVSQVSKYKASLVIVFSSVKYDLQKMLDGVISITGDMPLIGSSTAGEIFNGVEKEGVVVAVLASPHLTAKVGVGENIYGDYKKAVNQAFKSSFVAQKKKNQKIFPEEIASMQSWYHYKKPTFALLFTDGYHPTQASPINQILLNLKKKLAGNVPILGACSGDDLRFEASYQFVNGKVYTESMALAIIKSDLKFGTNVFHGFKPTKKTMLVTRANGHFVQELDYKSAAKVCADIMNVSLSEFKKSWFALFSKNPVGFVDLHGRYSLLLADALCDDGSIRFKTKVYENTILTFMELAKEDVFAGRQQMIRNILNKAEIESPSLVMVFSGVQRSPLLNDDLIDEVSEMKRSFLDTPVIGFYSYGEKGISDDETPICCAQSMNLFVLGDELGLVSKTANENAELLEQVISLKEFNQAIIDDIGYGITVFDENYLIVRANKTIEGIRNISLNNLIGKKCYQAYYNFSSPCGNCKVANVFKTGKAEHFKKNMEDAKGRDFYAGIDIYPLKDKEGKVVNVIEVIKDITDTKILQIQLEKEKNRIEAIVKGMAESISIIDREMTIQFANPVQEKFNPGVKLIGGKCYKAYFGRDTVCPWCPAVNTFKTGKVFRKTAHISNKWGLDRYCQFTSSPLRNENEEIETVVVLIVDITEQKKLEKRLIQAEKISSLGILAAGMAHEINNPLGAILFNTELLRGKGNLDKEDKQILRNIEEDTSRINKIVCDLLSYSRPKKYIGKSINIINIIEDSLRLSGYQTGSKNIKVIKDFDRKLQELEGDVNELGQVFINLFLNAKSAMPKGGNLKIRVRNCNNQTGKKKKIPTILIVDDEKEIVEMIKHSFKNKGYKVLEAVNGIEAISIAQKYRPDIVLLDYMMPGMNGLDVLKIIKKEYKNTKVIILTGQGSERAAVELMKAGADDYLKKPFEVNKLLLLIEDFIYKTNLDNGELFKGVEINITDTGVGIPEKNLEKIFDPFFTTKSEWKGTGLGLIVVSKIIDNYNGTIAVESKVGQGTTFTIKLPSPNDDN